MATYEIIITDVTRYGAKYCVAGWDCRNHVMIRPEPPAANTVCEASRFWDSRFAGPDRIFSVGNIVRFDALEPPNDFPFPHATEDRLCPPGFQHTIIDRLSIQEMVEKVADGISSSLRHVFGRALIGGFSQKPYVPAGNRGNSLGAIEVNSSEITFHETVFNSEPPKLRAIIRTKGAYYDVSIASDATKTRWKTGGLDGLQSDLQGSQRVHLRVGLARPFPNECYVQLNGLYFL